MPSFDEDKELSARDHVILEIRMLFKLLDDACNHKRKTSLVIQPLAGRGQGHSLVLSRRKLYIIGICIGLLEIK